MIWRPNGDSAAMIDPHRIHRAERELRRAVGAVSGSRLDAAQDIAGNPPAEIVIGDPVEGETRGLPGSALRAPSELPDDRFLDQRR